jgi:hypothetical protein
MILVLLVFPSMATVPAMKQMQEGTQQQQQIGQGAQNMRFMLFPIEKERDRGKSQKHKPSARF